MRKDEVISGSSVLEQSGDDETARNRIGREEGGKKIIGRGYV